jgi:hypothetical protein
VPHSWFPSTWARQILAWCRGCKHQYTHHLPLHNIFCTAANIHRPSQPNCRNHWLVLMNTHLQLDETLVLLFILILKNEAIAHE